MQRSLGSGFVIDKAGYIVTNYHVVASAAQSVHVSFSNNDSMKAQVVGKDPSTDIALLKVEASSRALKPLELGDSDTVQVGDQVAAIGNPFGYDRSISAGIVSALQRSLRSPDGSPIDRVIQTDASLNHGNSGGPLLNAQGQVIGVSSAVATGEAARREHVGIGFAIPINTVRDVVAQLKATRPGRPPAARRPRPLGHRRDRRSSSSCRRSAECSSSASSPAAARSRPACSAATSHVVVEGESYQLGGDLIVKAGGQDITSTGASARDRLRAQARRHALGRVLPRNRAQERRREAWSATSHSPGVARPTTDGSGPAGASTPGPGPSPPPCKTGP